MSSHDIYPKNVFEFAIRSVVEKAERGTILHAITNDQIRLMVKGKNH